ncbi:MAG: hypothetical protein K9G39_10795 [Chlorobium sp.]|uniref:hypothetical protein n=1 Tax=Chlorobium sp. TaxID=1095 RepID=UPI0025C10DA6|nr:hypothetical protein [Chlorobium sp.]MCF8384055.1 hypothetical protein [Chlorobium sp.]
MKELTKLKIRYGKVLQDNATTSGDDHHCRQQTNHSAPDKGGTSNQPAAISLCFVLYFGGKA